MTFVDTPNAISLPESAAGASPCASPGGTTTDPSGPAPALASLSARQAKATGLLTSGTYGPRGTISSASAGLQSYLESRLRARPDSCGSTLYKLTWKARATPAGRAIFALRASARRTFGKGSDSPPTICDLPQVGYNTPRGTDGANGGPNQAGGALPADAALTGWPTATTRDWKDGGNPEVNVPLNALLGRVTWLAGWPTATTPSGGQRSPEGTTAEGKTPEGRKVQVTLKDVAAMVGPALLTVSGEMLTGFTAGMTSGGQLNPEHSRWLMGYPAAWGSCGATAMQSIRTSSRRSSKPISTGKRSKPSHAKSVGYTVPTKPDESPNQNGAHPMTFTVTLVADSAQDLAAQVADLAAQFAGETEPAARPAARSKPAAKSKPETKAEEPATEPVAETAVKAEPTFTLADVKNKLAELVGLGEAGSKASIEIVSGLGALNEKGLPRADAIKPEQFAECVRLTQARIDELTPKGVL